MTRPTKWSALWTAGRLAGRRILGQSPGGADAELADQLAGQLDQMKGMAMKVGQAMSYLDVPLPVEAQERLARLQTGIQGMDASEVQAVLEDAFGVPVATLFDTFEPAPVAAASIGQVHRASFEGRAVAVKVQYPFVGASFDDDMGILRRIGGLASMATAVDGRAIVDELGARLEEECDYEREATMQAAFRRAFEADPHLSVPAVVPERCRSTVLTSQWIDGDPFETLRRDPDQSRRTTAAQALVRFTFRCMYELAAVQADPHPGNYLFAPGGPTTVLDYGCVGLLDVGMIEHLKRMVRALRDDDRAAFRQASVELGMVPNPRRFDFEHHFRVMEHLHRPLLQPDFRFPRAYFTEGLGYNGPSNPNARSLSIPPPFVWILRLQSGLWSVLGKLEPRADFRSICEEFLDRRIVPLRPVLRRVNEGPSETTV